MTDYTAIDAAVLDAIRTLPSTTFNPIFNAVRAQAEAVVAKSVQVRVLRQEPTEAWRVVDRRLQSLKLAGKIVYDRKTGWKVKEA